jgi:Fe-S-cluster containining protein
MFAQLEKLYRIVDDAVASISTAHAGAVHCRPGCADCCHAVFDVSFIEAARLALFLAENPLILASQQERAQQAAEVFEQLFRNGGDPATARIRCPLLGDDDLCLAHPVRPVNCRSYGTPTIIAGKAHVCGLSGFVGAQVYPSIDLAPLQERLSDYSRQLAGEEFAKRRFPIAWVVLRLEFFLPRGA